MSAQFSEAIFTAALEGSGQSTIAAGEFAAFAALPGAAGWADAVRHDYALEMGTPKTRSVRCTPSVHAMMSTVLLSPGGVEGLAAMGLGACYSAATSGAGPGPGVSSASSGSGSP